jgi:hypothetical protein
VSKNRHWREIRRSKPRLITRKRLLIVAEGEVTEPAYFRDLGRRVRTQVEVLIIGAGAVPVTVVDIAVKMKTQAAQEAKRQKDDFIPYDEIWCVFDVDSHHKLAQAINRAKANNIGVALSNPSFELWILLHYQDQRAHIERDRLNTVCRKHIPNYEKNPPCELLYPRLDAALARAINLERWQKQSGRPNENPSTDVHKLVSMIRKLAQQSVISQLEKHRK